MSDNFGVISRQKKDTLSSSSSSSSSSSRSNSSTKANRKSGGAASPSSPSSAAAAASGARSSPRDDLLRAQQERESEQRRIANSTSGSFMTRRNPNSAAAVGSPAFPASGNDGSRNASHSHGIIEESLDSPDAEGAKRNNRQQRAAAAAAAASEAPPPSSETAPQQQQQMPVAAATATTAVGGGGGAAAAASAAAGAFTMERKRPPQLQQPAPATGGGGSGRTSPVDEGGLLSRTAGLKRNNSGVKNAARAQYQAELEQRRAAAAAAAASTSSSAAASQNHAPVIVDEIGDDDDDAFANRGGKNNGALRASQYQQQQQQQSQAPASNSVVAQRLAQSNHGVGFAGLARIDELHKMWLTHAHSLYMFCTSHVLHWPSSCVEWLSDSRREIPTRDFSVAQIAVGSFAVDPQLAFPSASGNGDSKAAAAAASASAKPNRKPRASRRRKNNNNSDDDDDGDNNGDAWSDQGEAQDDDDDDGDFAQRRPPQSTTTTTTIRRDKDKSNYLSIYRVFLHCNPDLDAENDDVEEGAAAFRGAKGKFQDVAPLMPRHQRVLTDGPVVNIAAMPRKPTVMCFRGLTPEVHIVETERRDADPDSDLFMPDITLAGHRLPGYGIQWAPDNSKRILTAGNDGVVNVFSLGAHVYYAGHQFKTTYLAPLVSLQGHKDVCDNVTWHGSQPNLCASCCRDGEMIVWDIRQKKIAYAQALQEQHGRGSAYPSRVHMRQRTYIQQNSALYDIAFHPTADFLLATAGADRVVRVWDVRNFKEPCSLLVGHTGEVRGVRWAPFNETVLLSFDSDGGIFCWDIAKRFANVNEEGQVSAAVDDGTCSCDLVFRHLGHTGAVRDAKWAPFDEDEWTVASCDENNVLQLWAPHPDIYNDDVAADDGGIDDVV